MRRISVVAKSKSQKGVRDWIVKAVLYRNGLIEVDMDNFRFQFHRDRYPMSSSGNPFYDKLRFLKALAVVASEFDHDDFFLQRLCDEAYKAVEEVLQQIN